MARRTNNRQRGAGYIEVLVSSLILAMCILAALSLYGFSMSLVDKSGDESTAYNICRQSLEDARRKGFNSTDGSGNIALLDGTTTTYCNSNGGNIQSSKQGDSRFKIVETVTSSATNSLGQPAPDAIRTVVISVYYVSNNDLVETTGTLLVRSGV